MNNNKLKKYCSNSFYVGWFLATRQIRRSSKATTALIIFVMTLTFLNLVFITGILSGLVEGSSIAYRKQYSGDLILSTYETKDYISNSKSVTDTLNSFKEVESFTPRLLKGFSVEANYKDKEDVNDNADSLGTMFAGIVPYMEDSVTGLSKLVVAGEYLEYDDQNEILVGSNLLSNYARNVPGDETLANVDVGDKVRIRINNNYKELRIKGVVKSKIGAVGQRIYINDSYLRKLIEQPTQNVNEIAVLLTPGFDPEITKEGLKNSLDCDCAKIETWEESQGQFFNDISKTFNLLGGMIGGIGVVVASVTVFIVIFINAITRRRFIVIMKAIGICGSSIQISYLLQSLFYSVVGSAIGSLILFALIKPYIDENPVDFPFSDGILVAPLILTSVRIAILIFVTVLAGYFPAKIIVNKNTLDSILGR